MDTTTEIEVKTERKFLEKINADCDSPVGANAKVINKSINFSVTVPDKSKYGMFTLHSTGRLNKPEFLGQKVANILKKKFGDNFLQINNFKKNFSLLLTRPEKQSKEFKSTI